MIKIIIAGSRTCPANKKDILFSLLDIFLEFNENSGEDIVVVSGKAKGVDTFGEDYADIIGVKVEDFPAKWDDIEGKPAHEIKVNRGGFKYWVKAGHARNQEMADFANTSFIFWSGDAKSTGTLDMWRRAKKAKHTLFVYNYGLDKVEEIVL